MDPAITSSREGSTNDEGNQVSKGITQSRNPRWKSSLEHCAVLHNNKCKLCKEWMEHHDDDPTSFEQAKVAFCTGRDLALGLEQAHLEQEMSDACRETDELHDELQEVEAETERVQRDQKVIEDAGKQLQLQVVGKMHETIDHSQVESFDTRSASSAEPSSRQPRKRLHHTHTSSQVESFDARSASSAEPSSRRPRKRLCHTHTSSQSCPTTPGGPFATEQEPIYVSSGSES